MMGARNTAVQKRPQMVSHLSRGGLCWLLLLADQTAGHGRITRPASTRHGRSTAWFSNNVKIPGPPSLARPDLRTVQPNVTGQPQDVYVASPWRAPGSAPVLGSGCGVGGGDRLPYRNGGLCPGCPQGLDGKLLPKVGKPEEWKRGGTAEVAWMIAANHGGGYSWRLVSDAHRPHTSPVSVLRSSSLWPLTGTLFLSACVQCPADGEISEACFQSHPLEFAATTSDILYSNRTRVPIPLTTTRAGTVPKGSQWAKNPIPGCYLCDAYETCGPTLDPVSGMGASPDKEDACFGPATEARCQATNDIEGRECQWITVGSDRGYCRTDAPMSPALAWDQQTNCRADCGGGLASKVSGKCPGGTAIFPEPAPGISGWGKGGWDWSIADAVKVPAELKPGPYLLSWRWDCEGGYSEWRLLPSAPLHSVHVRCLLAASAFPLHVARVRARAQQDLLLTPNPCCYGACLVRVRREHPGVAELRGHRRRVGVSGHVNHA